MEMMCCMPCWPLLLPEEVGIILLDNLCAGDKKLKLLDKNKILTYQQVKYKEYWGQEVMLNQI